MHPLRPLRPLTNPLLLTLALAITTLITTATACQVSLECPPSQECIQGTCRVPGCERDIECDLGYLCYGGTCATGKYVGEGESCAGRDRCWADLWCDYSSDTCKRYLAVGEQCDSSVDRCEPGARCNLSGKCATYGLLGPSFGKPCYASDQCVDEGFPKGRLLVCRYGEFVDIANSWRVWQRGGRACGPPVVNH